MWDADPDDQSQDLLHSEDDKVDKNGEPEITCAVEAGDGDDDNDEFVEWNEGDGNLAFSMYLHCTHYNKRQNTRFSHH